MLFCHFRQSSEIWRRVSSWQTCVRYCCTPGWTDPRPHRTAASEPRAMTPVPCTEGSTRPMARTRSAPNLLDDGFNGEMPTEAKHFHDFPLVLFLLQLLSRNLVYFSATPKPTIISGCWCATASNHTLQDLEHAMAVLRRQHGQYKSEVLHHSNELQSRWHLEPHCSGLQSGWKLPGNDWRWRFFSTSVVLVPLRSTRNESNPPIWEQGFTTSKCPKLLMHVASNCLAPKFWTCCRQSLDRKRFLSVHCQCRLFVRWPWTRNHILWRVYPLQNCKLTCNALEGQLYEAQNLKDRSIGVAQKWFIRPKWKVANMKWTCERFQTGISQHWSMPTKASKNIVKVVMQEQAVELRGHLFVLFWRAFWGIVWVCFRAFWEQCSTTTWSPSKKSHSHVNTFANDKPYHATHQQRRREGEPWDISCFLFWVGPMSGNIFPWSGSSILETKQSHMEPDQGNTVGGLKFGYSNLWVLPKCLQRCGVMRCHGEWETACQTKVQDVFSRCTLWD